jgi:hypothetical protein
LPVFRFDRTLNVARGVRALLGLESERIAAEERAKRAERKERKKSRAQRKIPDQEVSYLSDKRRDPPPEQLETAHLRQVPDLMVLGTQRGGTTSLYRYLTEHPDIGPAFRKEVHFFERYYEKGLDWYMAHFPMRGEFPVVGEASPNYLFHPDVPERVRKAAPHARFIVLLRNPIDRAHSHYQMKVRRGIETLSFEEALDKERERLSSSDDAASPAWRHYSYLKRGLYVEQLQRWMSVFPREQFLIIKSEDFYEDPGKILNQTLGYLGLRPWTLARFRAHHLSEYADIDTVTYERLVHYFAPYNQQLYALLGHDLGW